MKTLVVFKICFCLLVAVQICQSQLQEHLETYRIYKHEFDENAVLSSGGVMAYAVERGQTLPEEDVPWAAVVDDVITGDIGAFKAIPSDVLNAESTVSLTELVSVTVFACRLSYRGRTDGAKSTILDILLDEPCSAINEWAGVPLTSVSVEERFAFNAAPEAIESLGLSTQIYAGVCQVRETLFVYGKVSTQQNLCGSDDVFDGHVFSFYVHSAAEVEDEEFLYISCDLEKAIEFDEECRIRQETDDDFDWTNGQGKTPSGTGSDRKYGEGLYPVTGPEVAEQGEHYQYIEATGKLAGMKASLLLEGTMFQASGKNCIRFFYNMNGFHTGTLNVFSESDTGRTTMFSLSGDRGPEWKAAAVDITDMKSYTKIGIEAITKGEFSGDIAVDNVTVTSGACSELADGFLYQCTFEANGASTLCSMTQESRDSTNWLLKSGSTPSKDTGPTTKDNDYYIYLEASPLNLYDNAKIYLPPLEHSGQLCVHFGYHMYGHHMGILTLFTWNGDQGHSENVLWSKQGNQGKQWHHGLVSVIYQPTSTIIGFNALRGRGHTSDIALNNIIVRKGACPIPEKPEEPELPETPEEPKEPENPREFEP